MGGSGSAPQTDKDLTSIAEARALARVRDGNVVTVHGADRHEGRVGLWMELVRGRTLSDILARQGPFSASEAAVIGQEASPGWSVRIT